MVQTVEVEARERVAGRGCLEEGFVDEVDGDGEAVQVGEEIHDVVGGVVA